MRNALLFALILFAIDFIFATTHSLQYVYSGSSGIPNLPEFMTVGLVDGEPFTYYDSNIRREVPRQEWMAKAVGPDYWDRTTQIYMDTEPVFKTNIEVAKQRFNQTGGIHTFQVMLGCEWDDETGATGAHEQFGYDGSDFIALDFKTMTYVAPVMQAVPTKQKWDSDRAQLENIKSYFTQECIEWLKKYVSYGKKTLERTVPPEVSLLQKDPSSPVTCHATGFFPKGIVVTWQKDGVDMHSDVEVEETLPNGDGTFQISSRLAVKPEDWKRNSYSCVVQHKSLQGDIAMLLEEKNIRTNQGGLPWGIIVGCVAAALALVAVVALWRRNRTGYGKAGISDPDSQKSPCSSDSEKTSIPDTDSQESPCSSDSKKISISDTDSQKSSLLFCNSSDSQKTSSSDTDSENSSQQQLKA